MSNVWIAAADNDIETVKNLIEQGGSSANDKDENGYTPIHAAASYGHLDLLKYLIEKGGDVNIIDNDGDTPLHACETPLIARALVEHGANPHVTNSEDQTPLDKAVDDQEFPELINYFMILMGKEVPQPAENVEFKANFQLEQQPAVPGERSLNDEQRQELASIIQNGNDADLELFLRQAMSEADASSAGDTTDSPSAKKSKSS